MRCSREMISNASIPLRMRQDVSTRGRCACRTIVKGNKTQRGNFQTCRRCAPVPSIACSLAVVLDESRPAAAACSGTYAICVQYLWTAVFIPVDSALHTHSAGTCWCAIQIKRSMQAWRQHACRRLLKPSFRVACIVADYTVTYNLGIRLLPG